MKEEAREMKEEILDEGRQQVDEEKTFLLEGRAKAQSGS